MTFKFLQGGRREISNFLSGPTPLHTLQVTFLLPVPKGYSPFKARRSAGTNHNEQKFFKGPKEGILMEQMGGAEACLPGLQPIGISKATSDSRAKLCWPITGVKRRGGSLYMTAAWTNGHVARGL